MFMFFAPRHYFWTDAAMSGVGYAGQTMWFGTKLDTTEQEDYGFPYSYYPDLVVFGDEVVVPAEATEATTTAPETSTPTTTAAVTTAATEAATTSGEAVDTTKTAADTTAAAEGGCGGTVTFAGVALMATLGTCAVFATKKKRD